MHESVIQRRHVGEDCQLGCKTLSLRRIMMLLREEVPANSVPAAAVIRGGQVLLGMIRRKGSFKRSIKLEVVLYGLNPYGLLRLLD